MLGAFAETIPLGGSDLIQMWSSGPYLGAIIEGLAGIRPHAGSHSLELFPQLPDELDHFKLGNVVVGEHVLDIAQEREQRGVVTIVKHVSGPVPLRCSLEWLSRSGQDISVNGEKTQVGTHFSLILGRELTVVERTLGSGETLRVVVR
jgi:hypothetical protein